MVENGNPKMCNLKTGGFVDISLFVDSDLIICNYFDCIFLSLLPITLRSNHIRTYNHFFFRNQINYSEIPHPEYMEYAYFFFFLRISSITHKLIKINVVV